MLPRLEAFGENQVMNARSCALPIIANVMGNASVTAHAHSKEICQ